MAPPRFDWITFDCYGTLIDWERGISDAFTAQAGRKGRTVDRSSVLDVYHAVEPVVEAETYRRYREVLGFAAEQVVERLGWTVPPEGTGFLAESLPSWPPFSDTNPALARLAGGGVKLGILSNVDDDLLAGTRATSTTSCRARRSAFRWRGSIGNGNPSDQRVRPIGNSAI